MLRRDKPGTAQNVKIGDGDRNQMKKTTAKYEYVLFDLDGTLTDPALGITNSVMYALKKFGISVSDRSELFRFIGPPLMYSFKTYYGFDDEKAKLALDYYRDRFADGGKWSARHLSERKCPYHPPVPYRKWGGPIRRACVAAWIFRSRYVR